MNREVSDLIWLWTSCSVGLCVTCCLPVMVCTHFPLESQAKCLHGSGLRSF